MDSKAWLLSLLLCVFVSPAQPARAHEHGHTPPSGGAASLDVYTQNDTLDLFVVENKNKYFSMNHMRSLDGGKTWKSNVIQVAGANIHSPHRGNDPRIVAFGDHLLAVWTAKGKSSWGSGDLQTAISSDGGKSWQPGGNPADDHAQGQMDHGYIALAADKHGTFHAVWFDPRDKKQGLRYSHSSDFGKTWSKNITIDPATCQCCWNSLYALDDSTLMVLYRALDPRDMVIKKSDDHGKSWRSLATVGNFDWHINACPHTGGSLAQTRAGKKTIFHSLVWTGKPAQHGLYILESIDEGKTWGHPRKVGGERAQHGDLAGHAHSLVAAWDELLDHQTVVRMQSSTDDGKTWSAPVTISSTKANATHPRVVFSAKAFQIFWTESAENAPARWAMKSLR
jgi:hypothetical protein